MSCFKNVMKLVALTTLLFTTKAMASHKWAAHLNKTKGSIESFEEGLKYMFPSREDSQLIDIDLAKLKAVVSKWKWRYEWDHDQVAFRVNGKVQMHFKIVDAENRLFVINNKKLKFPKPMSYLAARNKFAKFFTQNSASLERLFINEAQAIGAFPLLAFANLAGIAGAREYTRNSPTAQCVYRFCVSGAHGSGNLGLMRDFRRRAGNVAGRGDVRAAVKRHNSNCRSRIRRVAQNYTHYQNFIQKNPSNPVAACVARKMDLRQGWGMNQQAAHNICATAYTCYGIGSPAQPQQPQVPVAQPYPTAPAPAPATPAGPVYTDPVTPCYRLKANGQYEQVACPQQTPAYPQQPAPPAAPPVYDEPVTPAYECEKDAYGNCILEAPAAPNAESPPGNRD